MSPRLRALSAVSLLALCSVSGSVSADPVLRHQVDQRGDVAVFGAPLAYDCGSAVAPPDGATASCSGQLETSDSAPDLYWRDDIANSSISASQARTSATLDIPAGATVTYARLYWAALREGPDPDTEVILDWLGGPQTSITADDTWVLPYGFASHPDWYYYQATGDATDFVASWGAGDFRVSGVDAIPLADVKVDRAFSAWTLVVFYEDQSQPLRNLALFDGFTPIDPGMPGQGSASVTLSGFLVPPGQVSHMATFGYEGDDGASFTGDYFAINGTNVSNQNNPVDNFFNSSRTYLGDAFTGFADVPALTGEPGSMAGYDLDTVNITPQVSPGDTSAVVSAGSTYDIFFLGGFVTSIESLGPDFSNLTKTVVDLNGGALLAGDTVEYTLTATNNGTDTAVNVVLNDVLEPNLALVANTIQIVQGGPVGTKTNATGDDEGEYISGSRTVRVRLGTNADASTGGSIAPGESFTVKFRATVSGASGTQISNSAELTAGGEAGGPEKTWYTDSDPNSVGSQPTVIIINECQSDAQCSGTKPHCNVAIGQCQPCATDADCSNPATPACLSNGACGQCSATNQSQCQGSTPACDIAAGLCMLCTLGMDGNSSACENAPEGPQCVAGTGNTVHCGCFTDSDCGAQDSGIVCDTAGAQTCVPGCRGEGGNGCPVGLICTSTDSSIGQCITGSGGSGGSSGAAGSSGASGSSGNSGSAGSAASAAAGGNSNGGSGGSGGDSGKSGASGSAANGNTGDGITSTDDGSCGCEVPGKGKTTEGAISALFALALAFMGRRRSSKQSLSIRATTPAPKPPLHILLGFPPAAWHIGGRQAPVCTILTTPSTQTTARVWPAHGNPYTSQLDPMKSPQALSPNALRLSSTSPVCKPPTHIPSLRQYRSIYLLLDT